MYDLKRHRDECLARANEIKISDLDEIEREYLLLESINDIYNRKR